MDADNKAINDICNGDAQDDKENTNSNNNNSNEEASLQSDSNKDIS